MKIIDLLNKIANGEIEDKTRFRIYFANNMHRDIYYDDEEQNQLNCLKNVSDDYSIYDDICLLDEVEIIEEKKTIDDLNLSLQEIEAFQEARQIFLKLNNEEDKQTFIKLLLGEGTYERWLDYLKNKGE